MTMQEFVEKQLHELFLDLAERVANGEFGEMSEDAMCGVPMMIFKAEIHLINAWRRFDPSASHIIMERRSD